jgi:hypothetical protein
MLIQLPNGDWIDPSTVQSVTCNEEQVGIYTSLRNECGNITASWASDNPHTDRDALAEQINRSLYKEG